jgi:hypothetical protein
MHGGGRSRRLGVVCVAAAVAIAACHKESTTTSESVATAKLANYYDSVYKYELAHNKDTVFAYNLATLVERFPAYGAELDTFFVTTAAGSDRWFGFTARYVDSANGASPGDSIFLAVFYSDTSFNNVMLLEQDYPDSGAPVASAVFLQNRFSKSTTAQQVAISDSTVSVGATCSLQTGLAADSLLEQFGAGYACNTATQYVSATVQFPVSAGLGGFQAWAFANVTFVGDRFTAPAEAAQADGELMARATAVVHGLRARLPTPRAAD